MVIVKHGRPVTQASKLCFVRCSCECESIIANTDKRIYYNKGFYWFDCPKCGNKFRLSFSFVIDV